MTRANRRTSKWYNSDGYTTKSKYSAVLEEIKDREDEKENQRLIPYALTQYSISKGLRLFGKKAVNAVINKFVQLFKPKRTLVPIMKRYLEEREKIKKIRSSMFMKEIRDGNGISEKLKGRLVADGSQQNRTLYGGFQSSTTSLDAIILEPSG